MSSVAISAVSADTETTPLGKSERAPSIWGVILLAPYVFVFLAFVIYPVCYGFWIGRRPESYVTLFDDPIFARAVVNTLVFLIIGINLKMVVALFLSDFFVQQRVWIRWLAAIFILPWALPSIPTILSIRFMLNPGMGPRQFADLPPHRRGWPQLAQRSDAGAVARDPHPYLEIVAVLDLDPDRRAARDSPRSLRVRRRRRRHQVAGVPFRHLAVDARALSHLHDSLDDLDAR